MEMKLNGKYKGCCEVEPALIERMRHLVMGKTDAALNDRFGISYNTWRKLIAGEPIRVSLNERLAARIAYLESSESASSNTDHIC